MLWSFGTERLGIEQIQQQRHIEHYQPQSFQLEHALQNTRIVLQIGYK